ncbi:MAG: PadR family transcriptional regulator [Methanobrevibacter sp.]|uniref:PadR family transcriptional regulator n=1 Tax=uncultured Methanobrevibacter sp. TaxID=253161 RepID=UPI0025F692B8|nr:PadR family transcriptional regulator [uncultured Methanobrevibacter sp.]MEE1129236.1 PadR family transcriptional regulator [Methanobrevibacter sp.]
MTEEKNINNSPEKLIKFFTNGITHNLILWIISKQTIHGYGIMKKLDDFFNFEDTECDFSINSSKVYPILSKMEKKGLIVGEWKVNENNKRVKYYSITGEGITVLNHIQSHMKSILTNPSWINFIEDMTGKEINNEKRN